MPRPLGVQYKDKEVYINNKPISETYKVHYDIQIYTKDDYSDYRYVIRDNLGPVVVPPGHYFVMGDDYSDMDVKKIFSAIENKMKETRLMFQKIEPSPFAFISKRITYAYPRVDSS